MIPILEKLDMSRSVFLHRPGGYILLDGIERFHTHTCVHCNRVFVMQKGSGRVRGKCVRCNALTCGRSECNFCDPFERKMERMEQAARE